MYLLFMNNPSEGNTIVIVKRYFSLGNNKEKSMKILLATILFFASVITNALGHETPNTLDQIKQTGKIRIGYRESEPPMSFLK